MEVPDFFQMTVSMQQGCPLSPVLFNILLEEIKQKALTPHHKLENDCFADDVAGDADKIDTPLSSLSIKGRPLCNL